MLDEVPIAADGVTDSETGLSHSPLAYDAQGGLTVMWAERDTPNQNYQIYARRRAWGTFGPPILAVSYPDSQPGSLLGAKFPSVAAFGDSIFLVWHDYRHGGIFNSEIYGRAMALSGTRGPELRLTTTLHPGHPGDNGYVPSVAVTGGAVYVAWYDFRWDPNHADIFSKRRTAGGWVTPLGDSSDVNVSRAVTQGYSSDAPALAVTGDVAVPIHAIWADRRAGAGAQSRIRHAQFDAATGWSVPSTVAAAATSMEAPTAAVDADGTLYVVWVDGRQASHSLYTRSLPPGGAWGPEILLTDPTIEAGDPSLVATDDGALHLVWQDARIDFLNREIIYRRRPPGEAWDVSGAADVQLSFAAGRSDRPSIVSDDGVDAPGGPHLAVLWRDRRSGVNDIYLREFRPEGPIGIAPSWPESATIGSIVPSPLVRGANPWRGELALDPISGERVRVFDATGRVLITLAPGARLWDGRDRSGNPAAPGVYFLLGDLTGRAGRAVRLH